MPASGPIASPSIRVALLATAVDFGGIEKVLLTLLQHMSREVELIPVVFTRSDGRSRPFFEQLARLGIETRTLYVDRSRFKYLNPLRNIVEAIGVLRRERFDVIHSHGYRADMIALALSWFFRVPAVSTCHGLTSIDRRLAFYARLNMLMLRRFARVVAVSARMREDLLGLGLDQGRVAVVTNAVDQVSESSMRAARAGMRARLQLDERTLVLGFMGRLSDEKGLEHLLNALAVRPLQVPWRLVVVGDGPRRQELEQHAVNAGVSEHVVFAGFQTDTSPWYAAMDVFVLPSLTEGTPMALLEAMVRRLPVVATAVGGVPAIVSDRVNGLLVPPADPAAMSAALCEMAGRDDLRARLAQAGYETVRARYDVGTWIRSMRAVYEQALESARS